MALTQWLAVVSATLALGGLIAILTRRLPFHKAHEVDTNLPKLNIKPREAR